MDTLRIGDKVAVKDKGLEMLRQFAPQGAKPNNHGVIAEILDEETVLIEFPIGDDDMSEHSQSAPYSIYQVSKL